MLKPKVSDQASKLLNAGSTESTYSTKRTQATGATEPAEAVEPVKATKYTIALQPALLERLRNASYWSRDPVAAIIERAISAELDRMEKVNGEAFAPRTEKLRSGRPVR